MVLLADTMKHYLEKEKRNPPEAVDSGWRRFKVLWGLSSQEKQPESKNLEQRTFYTEKFIIKEKLQTRLHPSSSPFSSHDFSIPFVAKVLSVCMFPVW